MSKIILTIRFSILPLLILFMTGCSLTRPLERRVSYLTVSSKAEASMGDQFSEEIAKQYNLVDDPAAQAWLDKVGAKLVATSPETDQDFKFALTDSEQVNAFAIPGGYCYVNAGLITFADNEAQVIAVVGHEINHVTGRHGILRMQRQMGFGLIGAIASSIVKNSTARAATLAASQGATFLAQRQYSQTDELDADRKGVEAMYEAGWDPRGAANFFRKLKELNESNAPSFLESFVSTHPTNQKRIDKIEKMIEDMDLTKNLTVNNPEFMEIQQRLANRAETQASE